LTRYIFAGNVDFQCPFFFELFDMDKDPWQLSNIYEETKANEPEKINALHDEVQAWLRCKGQTCKPTGFDHGGISHGASAVGGGDDEGRMLFLTSHAQPEPAGCVPKPPQPPPPPAPAPVPAGMHIFMHGGLCLTGVADGNKAAPAVMANCTSSPPA
jgi:hypothetical protein